jgi:hypothetical protein
MSSRDDSYFNYFKLRRYKKHLLDFIFGSKEAEITYSVVSREFANELEGILGSVDLYKELKATIYIGISFQGLAAYADDKVDGRDDGIPSVSFYFDYAGNFIEYKTD